MDAGSLLEEWLAARASGDDRAAIDRGLRLVEARSCPLPVWLTLPGCWRRARGLDDLDDLIDSLAARPGTSGAERALLRIACAHLHPAALATTDAHPPELLLLASSLGASARGALDEAARLLPLCAPPHREPDLLGRIVLAESALASRGQPAWPTVPPPAAPPPPLAARIARVLLGRAGSLQRRGRLLPALGLTEEALSLAPPAGPLRVSLLLLAAELRGQLAEPATARALLGEALTLTPEPDQFARLKLALAGVFLEEDQPERAESLAHELLDDPAAIEHPRARLTLGIAQAAQENLDQATATLRQALAEASSGRPDLAEASDRPSLAGASADRPPTRDLAVASCQHWLGLIAAIQGDHAAAEPLLRRALASHPAPPGHPDLAPTLTALGTTLAALGRHDEATLRFREALVTLERSLGPRHPRSQVAASCLSDLAAWGDALALERELPRASLDDPQFIRQLRDFPGYILLRSQTSRRLLTVVHGGLTSGAVVFTAPDLAEAFLAQAPESLTRDLQYTSVSGTELAAHLRRHGADGAVLNCQGAARAVPLARWAGG